MPMPCSAEIVPPSSATASSTVVGDPFGVGRVEEVEVHVALGEVTERDQPCAVSLGGVAGRCR